MTKWEYKNVVYTDRRWQIPEHVLNELGSKGWEAVSIETVKDGVFGTFKRTVDTEIKTAGEPKGSSTLPNQSA